MGRSAIPQSQNRKEASASWVRFGWQGLSGLLPADWNIAAISGEHKQGFLRFDDSERPRLEIKWSQQHVDIGKNLEKYLKSLSQSKRGLNLRRPEPIDIRQDVQILSRRGKPGKRLQSFSWQQGEAYRGAGVMWGCEVCGRTVIAQVRGYGREDAVELARQVLSDLEDHGTDDKILWALYGLEFTAPDDYELAGQNLMAGYIDLSFRKKLSRLRVARWGLAETVLENVALRDWWLSMMTTKLMNPKRLPIRWQAQAAAVHEHPGLLTEAYTKRIPLQIWRAVRAQLPKWLGGAPAPKDGLAQVWHCAPANRIYMVETSGVPDEETLAAVAESIICH
jgi:hypothetical protein